jgi:hypothetical protein
VTGCTNLILKDHFKSKEHQILRVLQLLLADLGYTIEVRSCKHNQKASLTRAGYVNNLLPSSNPTCTKMFNNHIKHFR